MKYCFMTEHGPVEMVLIDGHMVSRVLDGIMFECRFDQTDTMRIAVNVPSESEEYFSTLNTEQLLDNMTRYVNRKNYRGVFDCDSFVCPNSQSYVWVEDVVHEIG
jgi:hypothetical protein